MVHIYTDGSVIISVAGVEMGQGLNIKILQIASRILKLPIDRINILEHASDKVPNALVTGGSMGIDIHGLAVKVSSFH